MAFIKKLALGTIFISILCIFGMSYNANALDFVLDLDNYAFQQTVRQSFACAYDTALTFNTTTTYCDLTGSNNNITAYKIAPKNYSNGDIITFDIVVSYNGFTFTNGETPGGYYTNPIEPPQIAASNDYYVLDIQQLYYDDTQHLINYYNEFFCRAQGSGTDCIGYPELTQSGVYYQAYRVYLQTKRKLDNYELTILGSSYRLLSINGYNIGNNYIRSYIYRYNIYTRTESQENKEVEQKTQEAVDDSQSAGSSSSSSASQAGSNLLTAITGFFNVITSAQPTNCRFNAPLNTYFGNERLNVDLCALDLPSGIGALTSIIAIGILIPFAIHMFNKFIALFRSFQS